MKLSSAPASATTNFERGLMSLEPKIPTASELALLRQRVRFVVTHNGNKFFASPFQYTRAEAATDIEKCCSVVVKLAISNKTRAKLDHEDCLRAIPRDLWDEVVAVDDPSVDDYLGRSDDTYDFIVTLYKKRAAPTS